MYQVKSPVVFIVFNRPDKATKVFEEIAKARPSKLLLIADGPRDSVLGEAERCSAVRKLIENVDWDCEVLTNFSEVNMGCKRRLSSGLDWVFTQVPEAIILEDDCLPSPSFFPFCDELLERYRHDDRIGMISGDNFQEGKLRGDGDYYFSKFCHIWGWATWARAWKKYDVNMSTWPQLKNERWLEKMDLTKSEIQHWEKSFDKVYFKGLDTWDHQWTLTCWKNDLISVMPNVNLISNIGFGVDATHTHGKSIFSNIPTHTLSFPLVHPSKIGVNEKADRFTAKHQFTNSYFWKIIRKLRGWIH